MARETVGRIDVHKSCHLSKKERKQLEKEKKRLAKMRADLNAKREKKLETEKARLRALAASSSPLADSSQPVRTVWQAAERGRIDILQASLAELGTANADGMTPLHFACQNNQEEVVGFLLSVRFVDPNATDKQGRTPLFIACAHRNKEIVRALIAAGARTSRNQSGVSPLSFFENEPDFIAEMNKRGLECRLEKRGADAPLDRPAPSVADSSPASRSETSPDDEPAVSFGPGFLPAAPSPPQPQPYPGLHNPIASVLGDLPPLPNPLSMSAPQFPVAALHYPPSAAGLSSSIGALHQSSFGIHPTQLPIGQIPLGVPVQLPTSTTGVAPIGTTGVAPIGTTGVVPIGPTGVVPIGPTGVVPIGPTGVAPIGPTGVAPIGTSVGTVAGPSTTSAGVLPTWGHYLLPVECLERHSVDRTNGLLRLTEGLAALNNTLLAVRRGDVTAAAQLSEKAAQLVQRFKDCKEVVGRSLQAAVLAQGERIASQLAAGQEQLVCLVGLIKAVAASQLSNELLQQLAQAIGLMAGTLCDMALTVAHRSSAHEALCAHLPAVLAVLRGSGVGGASTTAVAATLLGRTLTLCAVVPPPQQQQLACHACAAASALVAPSRHAAAATAVQQLVAALKAGATTPAPDHWSTDDHAALSAAFAECRTLVAVGGDAYSAAVHELLRLLEQASPAVFHFFGLPWASAADFSPLAEHFSRLAESLAACARQLALGALRVDVADAAAVEKVQNLLACAHWLFLCALLVVYPAASMPPKGFFSSALLVSLTTIALP